MNAGIVVNEALLGKDFKTVVVAGKAYTIKPPTICRISEAALCLSDVPGEVKTVEGFIHAQREIRNVAKALSWFIMGDESLAGELAKGTIEELGEALDEAYSLMSVKNFSTLLDSAKNIVNLTARQKL